MRQSAIGLILMKKYWPIYIISPAVLILDQITKVLILCYIKIGQAVPVIPNYFEIVHVRNRGAAFGILSRWNSGAREWFFYGISVVAMAALFTLYVKTKERERRIQIPLAFILGGAIGNLIDRIIRGEVVDFLRFHWEDKVAQFSFFGKTWRFVLSWPSFNVADIAITCGAIYLVIVILFFSKRKPG